MPKNILFAVQVALLLYIPIAFPGLVYLQCAHASYLGCGSLALLITLCSFIIGTMFVSHVLDNRLSKLGCFFVGLANAASIALGVERVLTPDVNDGIKFIIVIVMTVLWHTLYCFCMKWSAVACNFCDCEWFPISFLWLLPKRIRPAFAICSRHAARDLENTAANASAGQKDDFAAQNIPLEAQTPYEYDPVAHDDGWAEEAHTSSGADQH